MPVTLSVHLLDEYCAGVLTVEGNKAMQEDGYKIKTLYRSLAVEDSDCPPKVLKVVNMIAEFMKEKFGVDRVR